MLPLFRSLLVCLSYHMSQVITRINIDELTTTFIGVKCEEKWIQ